MNHGKHLILDLYHCDQDYLDDYDRLSDLLEVALQKANATILQIMGKKFQPQGVTLLALLAESHASIHTWPELGYCAIDLYTCGDQTNGHEAANYIKEELKAQFAEEKQITRSVTLNFDTSAPPINGLVWV